MENRVSELPNRTHFTAAFAWALTFFTATFFIQQFTHPKAIHPLQPYGLYDKPEFAIVPTHKIFIISANSILPWLFVSPWNIPELLGGPSCWRRGGGLVCGAAATVGLVFVGILFVICWVLFERLFRWRLMHVRISKTFIAVLCSIWVVSVGVGSWYMWHEVIRPLGRFNAMILQLERATDKTLLPPGTELYAWYSDRQKLFLEYREKNVIYNVSLYFFDQKQEFSSSEFCSGTWRRSGGQFEGRLVFGELSVGDVWLCTHATGRVFSEEYIGYLDLARSIVVSMQVGYETENYSIPKDPNFIPGFIAYYRS